MVGCAGFAWGLVEVGPVSDPSVDTHYEDRCCCPCKLKEFIGYSLTFTDHAYDPAS